MVAGATRSIPWAGQTITDSEWQELTGSWRSDGVYRGLLNELAVAQRAAGANMSVDVATGVTLTRGIESTWGTLSNLTIAANGSGNPRIDLIVARLLLSGSSAQLDVLQGTPGVTPVAPTPTSNALLKEIPLATVDVASGAASIVTANISDRRTPSSGPGGARAWTMTAAATLPFGPDPEHPCDITLPITGATAITAIPIAPAGSLLRLEAQSTMTVSISATLGLTATFNGVSSGAPLTRSVLILQSDGTNWIEVARSPLSTIGPACRAFNNANLALTSTVSAALTLNSEAYDNASLHSTSVNTSRITIAVPGIYAIDGTAVFAANATGHRWLFIRLNAGNILASQLTDNTGAGTMVHLNVSTSAPLVAGDFVELWAEQNSGGALDIVAVATYSPSFGVTYIGRAT